MVSVVSEVERVTRDGGRRLALSKISEEPVREQEPA